MDSHSHDSPHFIISRTRLEFLFDGIFAIAMTILVLELKVPDLTDRRSTAELWQALIHHAPTFGAYLLSFIVLGIFWYRHNHYYRHLQHITMGMLALHLAQLSMAAFFPFAAALLGRYPINGLASLVYVGCGMVYLWCSFFTWIVANRAGAIDPQFGNSNYVRYRNGSLRGCLVLTVLFSIYLVRLVA